MTGNPESENALLSILKQVDEELQPLRIRQAETQWQASISGSEEDHHLAEEAEIALRLKLSDDKVFNEISEWLKDPGVQDAQLRRWATMMRLEIAPNKLPSETIMALVSRQKKIEAAFNTHRPEIAGRTVSANEITEILRTSKDNALCKQAWEASKEIGLIVQEELRELVRARNLAARNLGYPDYYRMILELQEIDEARLFSSFGRFADLSEDEFRRMKAFLDSELAKRFRIDAVDLAPWHYSDPFFQECPAVFGVDTEPIFKGRNTLEWCKRYFTRMGLPIDQIIPKGSYYESPGKHETAFCSDIDRNGEVRVLLNLKDNGYWASSALHEFGHAAFYLNIDRSMPYSLRIPAHISISEAIAMFFARLPYEMEWLIEMFGLPGSVIREMEQPIKEEQRMRMAIFARWMLVMAHFERGLYRDPDYDQQSRWWDLVERFQLLRRPDRGKQAADWATKPHILLFPVYYHNYMLGEWIASQLHFTLIDHFNLKEPVIWNDRPEVGKWMIENIFKPGASIGFYELIRDLTGAMPMPDDFVRQYIG